jgi:hypothetical protein
MIQTILILLGGSLVFFLVAFKVSLKIWRMEEQDNNKEVW